MAQGDACAKRVARESPTSYTATMEDGFPTILQRARAGDPKAMEALLAPHLAGLHAFVRMRLTGALARRESTTDIVQSICGDLLEDIAQLRSKDELSFRAWLFRLAAHKLATKAAFHRAAKRDIGREWLGRPVPQEDILRAFSPVASPSQMATAKEELQRIEKAFDALPEDYRLVIAQVCVAGFSYDEVARFMDRTTDSVRQLLHRARARLATLLDRED